MQRIVLSNLYCKDIFQSNYPHAFINKLPESIDLRGKAVSLVSVCFSGSLKELESYNQPIFITSNICHRSICADREAPLLGILSTADCGDIGNPWRVPCLDIQTDIILIELSDGNYAPCRIESDCYVVLEFSQLIRM